MDFSLSVPSRARFRWWVLALIGGLVMRQVGGQAQVTVYTDRSLFSAALDSSTTIDFAGIPDPPRSPIRTPLTLSGVTFSNYLGLSTGQGYLRDLGFARQPDPIRIVLSNGVNAFGADFSGAVLEPPFEGYLTFTLEDGQAFHHLFECDSNSWTFFGFVFAQPIESVLFDGGGGILFRSPYVRMLDNVIFGVAVPEPQLLSLVCLGVVASIGLRRRQGN